jgi:hypothetical protein
MDVLDRAIEDMKARGVLNELARSTGIPAKTLRNLKYRTTKNPGYDLVKRLQAHYERQDKAA